MEIKGISRDIVNRLVERTVSLSQGRNAGCIAFVNQEGIIDGATEVADGGISGLPLRQMLGKITDINNRCILEGLETLPSNSVLITTKPGKTGLVTDVSGVDFFNIPIVSIGVKDGAAVGVGVVYPKDDYFDLATESEQIDLETLAAVSMEDEKSVLRHGVDLTYHYLDITHPLQVVEVADKSMKDNAIQQKWQLPRVKVNSIDQKLAKELVDRSMEVGQGREVGMVALVDDNGHVIPQGQVVVGGMGYIPSRLLASSAVDITGKSLREIYSRHVPDKAIIVHTHPGGTGVMHIGDASAGPGTWGRPIIAIGHDKDGNIRGATVIEVSDHLYALADEDERLGQEFFEAETPDKEADIRNRKFGIAQEYTGLCKPIELT
ncbi:MAG: peptidase S7 [Thermincolia bacterium]